MQVRRQFNRAGIDFQPRCLFKHIQSEGIFSTRSDFLRDFVGHDHTRVKFAQDFRLPVAAVSAMSGVVLVTTALA